MLLPWADRILIYLHPERVVLVRQTGVLKKRVTHKHLITTIEPSENRWSNSIAALNALLTKAECQGARAAIILSNHFIRYRVAPSNHKLDQHDKLTQEEQEALLRHHFEEIYGEQMHNWALAISDAGFSKQGLACAVDPHLIAALKDSFSRSTSQLISVKPFSMVAFNQWRKLIDGQNAWWIVVEYGRLCIGLIKDNEWRSIRCKPCELGWENSLELLLERESLQLGLDTTITPLYFYWAEKPGFKPDMAKQRPVNVLSLAACEGFSPHNDAEISVAMCN